MGYLCDKVAVMYRGRIMEYAPADALFDNPHHFYTHLLISAIPDTERPDKTVDVLSESEDEPPDNQQPAAASPIAARKKMRASLKPKCPSKKSEKTTSSAAAN